MWLREVAWDNDFHLTFTCPSIVRVVSEYQHSLSLATPYQPSLGKMVPCLTSLASFEPRCSQNCKADRQYIRKPYIIIMRPQKNTSHYTLRQFWDGFQADVYIAKNINILFSFFFPLDLSVSSYASTSLNSDIDISFLPVIQTSYSSPLYRQ